MLDPQELVTVKVDRFVEQQLDVDLFKPVWEEQVETELTLAQCRELVSSGVLSAEQVLEAALEQDWANTDMNLYKYELEHCTGGDFWHSESDLDGFEKRLNKFLGYS